MPPSFAATGDKAGDYAITGPQWTGTLPTGVKQIKSDTNMLCGFAEYSVLKRQSSVFLKQPASKIIRGCAAAQNLSSRPTDMRELEAGTIIRSSGVQIELRAGRFWNWRLRGRACWKAASEDSAIAAAEFSASGDRGSLAGKTAARSSGFF
jgi:hypothetical protein